VLLTELGPDAYDSDTDSNDSNRQPNKVNNKVDDLSNDEEWDTDLEEGEFEIFLKKLKKKIKLYFNYFSIIFQDTKEASKEESHDTTGRNEYKKMCDSLNVVPCSYFMAHVEDQTLVLKYHQFSSDEIRAISKPLWVCYIKQA
jgi:hypothetical protein